MEVLTEAEPERVAGLLEQDAFFWLDLVDPSDDELTQVAERLDLHPLALEDTMEWGQRPKLDRYGDHALLVYYSVRHAGEDHEELFEPLEVHLHLSGSFVLTVRRGRCDALDDLRGSPPSSDASEAGIIYGILDTLTDAFYPVLDSIEQRIDALELAVLERPQEDQLRAAYRLRQEVHELHRRVIPERDQFHYSAETILGLPGLSHGSRDYLRDIGDHLAQIAGELARQREDLGALTSTYYNANTARLNRTATRLTVVATFFLAWTLVTGFFGQNFGWLERRIEPLWAFLVFGLGGLVVPTLLLAVYFWRRRRDWR